MGFVCLFVCFYYIRISFGFNKRFSHALKLRESELNKSSVKEWPPAFRKLCDGVLWILPACMQGEGDGEGSSGSITCRSLQA